MTLKESYRAFRRNKWKILATRSIRKMTIPDRKKKGKIVSRSIMPSKEIRNRSRERSSFLSGYDVAAAGRSIFDIQSYKDQKIERDAAEGITPYIRSARLIVIFFVFNVFIGLMGTFWFRTRHRRSEIALRMAMGSSRGRIRWQLLGEGLLLLALASIPALMICINMVMADVTFTEATDATWGRFVICVSIVWILMALMVIAGIWYPASRAMKVQPAEALHDE